MRASLLLFFGFILFTGCLSTKDYVVDSDYSYKGNFKKYKTYMFVENAWNDQNVPSDLDASLKKMIRNRMGAQGYKFVEKKADLLVNYKVYIKDLNFIGVEQPKLEYWIKNARYDEDGNRIKYDDDSYDFETRKLKEGALLITFLDRKKRSSVWHGYSSGFYTTSFEKSDRYIRAAVNQIFDEYKVIAEGYDIRRN